MKLELSALDSKLREAVREIALLVGNAGGRALIVGGAVRDLILQLGSVKDVDIEVYGIESERLKDVVGKRFEFQTCGVSFGVLKLKRLDIDISLPRRESKRGAGHRAFFVDSDPFLSVPEAASRRDFTVNAMYCDPLTGEVIDPYGGLSDLENRVLRHVSDKFGEDPLRVLRGMQFIARFDLTPAAETVTVCRKMQIEGLAAERLYEEWSKLLLKGKAISKGMEFLRTTGWVDYFPEVKRLAESPDDWRTTLKALDAFAATRVGSTAEDAIVGFSVLCRHLESPSDFLKRLTADSQLLAEVPRLAGASKLPGKMASECASDGEVRRFSLKVGCVARLLRIVRAYGESDTASWLQSRATALGVLDVPPSPILMGRHLIEMGMKPGREFNSILQTAFAAQLDGKFSDLNGAIDFIGKSNVV